MSEWFFIQSMKKRRYEREVKEEKLSAIRAEIKEALRSKTLLKKQLDSISKSAQPHHPIRAAWLKSSAMYWALIADMHDLEQDKSVTPDKP